jgi:hypothetical protein
MLKRRSNRGRTGCPENSGSRREGRFGAWRWRVAWSSRARQNEPPDGKGLARLLADRFLGGQFSDGVLSQVSEHAISESSLVDVQEFIRGIFEKFEPALANS